MEALAAVLALLQLDAHTPRMPVVRWTSAPPCACGCVVAGGTGWGVRFHIYSIIRTRRSVRDCRGGWCEWSTVLRTRCRPEKCW